MRAFANTLIVAAVLSIVSLIFGLDAWGIIAWLIGLFVGAALFSILLAAHRRMKKWQPYWWVWSSVKFPFDYWRTKRDARTAGDKELRDAANLLFSTPKTWFTMRMLRIIGKEMNRRHKEMKTFESKGL